MAKVITDNKHYIAIADAIRSASFGEIEGQMAPHEFAQRIGEISVIGQEQGRTAGYAQGVEAGKTAGVQSEYDRFWDEYQSNGIKKAYMFAFAGTCWTDTTFHPKYPIVIGGYSPSVFANSNITSTKVPVTVATPNASNLFNYAAALEEISSLTIADNVSTYSGWFMGCDKLTELNITSDSVIVGNGFNVSYCVLLTHGSLMSIINALQDKSRTDTTWAVTLGATNLAKLTDAEKAIATQRGWTLA